jgi:hypothetical protein
MSASLTVIAAAAREPKTREKKLHQELHDTENALYADLCAAGLLLAPTISPGAEPRTSTERVLVDLWHARIDYTGYLDRRIWQLERALRKLLTTDTPLPVEQRDEARTATDGDTRRDGSILSDAERSMIDAYRATDAAGKQMLRTLFTRLATSSQGGEQ